MAHKLIPQRIAILPNLNDTPPKNAQPNSGKTTSSPPPVPNYPNAQPTRTTKTIGTQHWGKSTSTPPPVRGGKSTTGPGLKKVERDVVELTLFAPAARQDPSMQLLDCDLLLGAMDLTALCCH